MTDDFGTAPRLLARADAPDTSREAAESVDTNRLERLVYDAIASFGPRGCTIDEVRRMHPELHYSSVTARPAALIRKGLVRRPTEVRPGDSGRPQRVLVAAVHVGGCGEAQV
jgi:hypothetical protein